MAVEQELHIDYEIIHQWYRNDKAYRELVDGLTEFITEAEITSDRLLHAAIAVHMFRRPDVLAAVRKGAN